MDNRKAVLIRLPEDDYIKLKAKANYFGFSMTSFVTLLVKIAVKYENIFEIIATDDKLD